MINQLFRNVYITYTIHREHQSEQPYIILNFTYFRSYIPILFSIYTCTGPYLLILNLLNGNCTYRKFSYDHDNYLKHFQRTSLFYPEYLH